MSPERALRRCSSFSGEDEPRAGGADRMAERDRAAVRFSRRPDRQAATLCQHGEHLRGEGFVISRSASASVRSGRPAAFDGEHRAQAHARADRSRRRHGARCARAAEASARAARGSVITSSATAPSVICEELPAVTVPAFARRPDAVWRALPASSRAGPRCRAAMTLPAADRSGRFPLRAAPSRRPRADAIGRRTILIAPGDPVLAREQLRRFAHVQSGTPDRSGRVAAR